MNSELGRRVAFTLGALLVYRLGSYIPLPGIDTAALATIFHGEARGAIAGLDLLGGGSIRRLAIFALGILPYLTAALLVQLVCLFGPGFRASRRGGEESRRRILRYTLYLTLVLTLFQSFGLAQAFEGVARLVPQPGWLFRLSTVATLTGGTFFLVWLSNQITLRGVGNGLALILLVGIVIEMPRTIVTTIGAGQRGIVSTDAIAIAVLAAGLVALIVVMELGRRYLPIEFLGRDIGGSAVSGRASLPLKLNGAGLIPTILATWILAVVRVGIVLTASRDATWWSALGRALGPGHLLHIVVYALLIVLCAFLYTALIFDPEGAARDLKDYGGVLAGIETGEPTAAHFDHVVSRTTLIGAVYLAFVCLIPEILIATLHVPFYFSGVSLLIAVCAIVDLRAQVQGYALVRLRS